MRSRLQFRMRSACSCIVCDHINLHTNSQSFLHFVHPSPLFALFSLFLPCFFFLFFPCPLFSANWVRFSFISLSLLVAASFLFALHTFGHPRTLTNLWFLLNPLALYSNWFELSRPTFTSARLYCVVLSRPLIRSLCRSLRDSLTYI